MELGKVYIRYGVMPGEQFKELEGPLDEVMKAKGFVLEAEGYDEFVGARCLTYKSKWGRVGMTTIDQIRAGEVELPPASPQGEKE